MKINKPEDNFGFLRVASAVPAVLVGDVDANTKAIIGQIVSASDKGAKIIVFPELCVTSYTCADLFAQEALLQKAALALDEIRNHCGESLVFVGVPLLHEGRVFNCAVAMNNGKILGVVPKTYLPNYSEFYEKRWFATADDIKAGETIAINGEKYPFGTNLLLEYQGIKVAAEICEDLWTTIPPSSIAALNGANVVVNLSASTEVIGKHAYLRSLIQQQSARNLCAYIYSSAGYGESTTDVVYGGNAIIAEYGTILAEGKRFDTEPQIVMCDIDISLINATRIHNGSFADSTRQHKADFQCLPANLGELPLPKTLMRNVNAHPFVPADGRILDSRCEEILSIQVLGLMKRLEATRCNNIVVGVSGGLDSTLALLVAVEAFRRLCLDAKGIHGITMPGFGTTNRTHSNANTLMRSLGISCKEISIVEAVQQHFMDIGHNIKVQDVTYENCQARERTQILMDYANRVNGFVLGTGDLSELALGWCTYNADQMSMYGVNASIPKTLVKYLVQWFALNAAQRWGEECKNTLLDIVDTPISPELTPADEHGNIKQKTEDLVGPYELHDFFIYNMMHYGFSPKKIYYLAKTAFAGSYSAAIIKHWLTTFYSRFFSQQFKRSCMPDGPKVGSVTLSPRGDWRMPSDASSLLWKNELEDLPE